MFQTFDQVQAYVAERGVRRSISSFAIKREAEYYRVRNRPHPFEMQLYFDV